MSIVSWESLSLSLSLSLSMALCHSFHGSACLSTWHYVICITGEFLPLCLYGTMSFVSWERFSIHMVDMALCRLYHGSVFSLSLSPSLSMELCHSYRGNFFYINMADMALCRLYHGSVSLYLSLSLYIYIYICNYIHIITCIYIYSTMSMSFVSWELLSIHMADLALCRLYDGSASLFLSSSLSLYGTMSFVSWELFSIDMADMALCCLYHGRVSLSLSLSLSLALCRSDHRSFFLSTWLTWHHVVSIMGAFLSLSLSLLLYGTMSFVSWELFSIHMADIALCRWYHGSVSLSLSLSVYGTTFLSTWLTWHYVVCIMGAFLFFSLSLSLSLYGTMSFVSWELLSIRMADLALCRLYDGSVSLTLSLSLSLSLSLVWIMGVFFY